MATVDGTDLIFLRDDREIARSALWASRLLVGLMLLAAPQIVLRPLAAQQPFRALGAILGAVAMLSLVYWGTLAYQAE